MENINKYKHENSLPPYMPSFLVVLYLKSIPKPISIVFKLSGLQVVFHKVLKYRSA